MIEEEVIRGTLDAMFYSFEKLEPHFMWLLRSDDRQPGGRKYFCNLIDERTLEDGATTPATVMYGCYADTPQKALTEAYKKLLKGVN